MSEALIVGAGETPYSRHPDAGLTTHRLLAQAGRAALASAGLEAGDVDGLGVASFSLVPDRAIDLAFRLGLRPRWVMDGMTGGASGVDMLQHARRAVEAGDARAVLLLAGDRLDRDDFVRLVDDFNTATRDHLAAIPTGGPNAPASPPSRTWPSTRGGSPPWKDFVGVLQWVRQREQASRRTPP